MLCSQMCNHLLRTDGIFALLAYNDGELRRTDKKLVGGGNGRHCGGGIYISCAMYATTSS